MSSKDVAISVQCLSKVYTLAHQSTHATTAAEAVMQRIRRPFHREEKESFWALRDVSFEIEKGTVVGIIGRNGAGKSTLLKILSRITEPTAGQVALYGRVGSLLEVGTGFHPELTGRENIFLNGAILGMSRREITKHFDAIVAFAEVEKFLDTPVKRYSSGMYVRLAFAVAAHLQSEILVVDEVLAVGDAAFQKKCLGKMDEVAKMGRTILFVSHNMSTLASLCTHGIFLENGRVVPTGSITEAIQRYASLSADHAGLHWQGSIGDENLILQETKIHSSEDRLGYFFRGDAFDLDMTYTILKPNPNYVIGVEVYNTKGVFLCATTLTGYLKGENLERAIQVGSHHARVRFDTALFAEGSYLIKFDFGIHNAKRIIEDQPVMAFSVLDPTKNTSQEHGSRQNIIAPSWEWNTRFSE